jgi:hypothetical protein
MKRLIIIILSLVIFSQCSYKVSSEKSLTTVRGFIVIDSRNIRREPNLDDVVYFIFTKKTNYKGKFKTNTLDQAYVVNKPALGLGKFKDKFKDKFKRICDESRCIDYCFVEITCRALSPLKKDECKIIIDFESKEIEYVLKAQYLVVGSTKPYPYER